VTELGAFSNETGEAAKEMVMAGHTQTAITPRDRFLQAAEKEMIKFERQEKEFRKKERADRAAELHLPTMKLVNSTKLQLMRRNKSWPPD
jgi:hypothetical protein